jgi:uncharacterized protein (DUF433 family)
MGITFQADAPPLREDASGAVRVGESRVLLELVIHAFQDGATPEVIVQSYPSVTLADVYGVIAYYLRHKVAVEQYLAEREQKASEVQGRLASSQRDLSDIRSRLLARRGA